MKTIYVTYVDRQGLRRRARDLVQAAVVMTLLAMAIIGHVITLLLGALDAYVTAVIGVPRLSYGSRRFAQVVRESWEQDL